MMRAKSHIALVPALACLAALACSSSDRTVDVSDDAGTEDGGAPAPEASAPDSAVADTSTPVPGTPHALEVKCESDPCYVAVSGNGGHHVCGLVHDGTVRCWGRDTIEPPESIDGGPPVGEGALGRGVSVSGTDAATPVAVLGLSNVTQISVGPNLGTCARTAEGAVYCWGRNDFGQLGRDPSERTLPLPTRVEGLPPVDRVELGNHSACAIGADRALYCWGEKTSGLGLDDDGEMTFSPRRISTFRAPIHSLVMGTWETKDTIIALLDGYVLATAGDSPVGETSLVNNVPLAPLEVGKVRLAGAFAYVTTEGLLERWQNQWGTIIVDSSYIPSSELLVDLKVSGANLVKPLQPPQQQGGAVSSTGRFFRWGPNTAGTLGMPPETVVESRYPVEVLAVKSKVVSFAMTYRSTCVSLVNGTIECWGANAFGELGRGTLDLDPHSEPEVIR
jgi:Regulator of chromosome condensation (RCC1) repeat